MLELKPRQRLFNLNVYLVYLSLSREKSGGFEKI